MSHRVTGRQSDAPPPPCPSTYLPIATYEALSLACSEIRLTRFRRQPGLGSFSIVHFAGYLFFLLMPVEALVPYYHAEGHAAMILVGLSVGTAIMAQLIDYGVGRLLSERVVSILGHRKYERFNRTIDRHGSWAILVFNLLPLSSPNVILVAGIMRFSLGRTVLISVGGLVGKYLTIVYLFG